MRVLIDSGSGILPEAGQRIGLDEDEANHLRVRRASEREEVEILDGAGGRGIGRLVQVGKHWEIEIQRLEREPRPAELTLAVGAGDRDRFSWVVEKAVELGVTIIVPLRTSRTAGVASGLKDRHLPRLRRHALEAIKQCGAVWAMQVEDLVPLERFLKTKPGGVKWLADQSGAAPPTLLDQSPMTVVVGPEGGLTQDERSALLEVGYVPVSLGPHTLRFETAALAAAATASIARMRGSHG